MKTIQNYASYTINGKEILIVSDNYHGSPIMCYAYDVLIGSKKIIKRYKKELFPKTSVKKGRATIVRYI